MRLAPHMLGPAQAQWAPIPLARRRRRALVVHLGPLRCSRPSRRAHRMRLVRHRQGQCACRRRALAHPRHRCTSPIPSLEAQACQPCRVARRRLQATTTRRARTPLHHRLGRTHSTCTAHHWDPWVTIHTCIHTRRSTRSTSCRMRASPRSRQVARPRRRQAVRHRPALVGHRRPASVGQPCLAHHKAHCLLAPCLTITTITTTMDTRPCPCPRPAMGCRPQRRRARRQVLEVARALGR